MDSTRVRECRRYVELCVKLSRLDGGERRTTGWRMPVLSACERAESLMDVIVAMRFAEDDDLVVPWLAVL